MFKKIIKKLTGFLFKKKLTEILISAQRKAIKKYTIFLTKIKSERFTNIIFSKSFIVFTIKDVIIKAHKRSLITSKKNYKCDISARRIYTIIITKIKTQNSLI